MAAEEVTGATAKELKSKRGWYYNTDPWLEGRVPFETAFCLARIGKQPDDYDGPTRYCQKWAARVEDYGGSEFDEAAFEPACRFHGAELDHGEHNEHLDKLANIKHGLYTEDEHLKMDFSEDEQKVYDRIMDGWPEAYDWPPREEDPARYRLLDTVATNIVRQERCEDYIDDEGEVYLKPIFAEGAGQIGEEDTSNPLAREYRLLISQILDMLKELGLTPKERQKMETLESEASHHDAVAEIAGDALEKGEGEYDPNEFVSDDGADADTSEDDATT